MVARQSEVSSVGYVPECDISIVHMACLFSLVLNARLQFFFILIRFAYFRNFAKNVLEFDNVFIS